MKTWILTIVQSSVNYILAYGVYKNSGPIFNLLCIYGDPSHRATSAMWSEISSFVVHSSHIPTFCMGDLNEIMHANEKYGLAPPHSKAIVLLIFKHPVNQSGAYGYGL
ncbi:Os04g0371500 [Oryza sativa Japonica Group]|uniref:Os04g0371500 protein n=1 Tax=Oryza sativa subsp. japonica TaxID=39947 RepID=A0A0P0W953_ORYSJ|nr:Os04g0371500 [Oryza sativa Japonica Group]